MKKFRSIQLACLFLCLICFFLSGCGSKSKPDEDVVNICKAILQKDKDSASKLNLDSEKLYDNLLNSLIERLHDDMLSKEQAKRMGEAFINSLKKVNISAKTISKDGDNAEVELTITPIDLKTALDNDALMKEMENRMSPYPSEKELAELITQIMVEKINNASPAGDKKMKVSCTYDKKEKLWMPNNMDQFSEQLAVTALGF